MRRHEARSKTVRWTVLPLRVAQTGTASRAERSASSADAKHMPSCQARHNGILTLIESGYSVFLLKIPLFQRVYGTFDDFEAELVELNSMFFSFHFAKTDTHFSTRQIYGYNRQIYAFKRNIFLIFC